MENLPSNNRKLNKPSKHRASSFRGEFQRFYGRLHDCERIDTTHDGHISEDVEEDSPTELTRNTVMPVVSSDYISTSPLSSRQNTSIFRSASTSVKTPDRKLRRLKSSRSAVTFKEMKKTLKKSDSLYHSHLSEVQAPFPRLESDSVIQKDSEQSLDYRNNATKDSVRPDFTPLDDLLVDLPDDQVSDHESSSENDVVSPITSPTLESNSIEIKDESPRSQSFPSAYPLCKECGLKHRISENHEYDYAQDIDDDFLCDVCLQPFVEPYDSKCGHTFCCVCLKNYVRLKKSCPIDRQQLSFVPSECWQSSLVLRRLVDKMVVHCPNKTHCQLTMARASLAGHLKERCPGSVIRCRFAMFGCSYRGPRIEENEHITNCKFQGFKGNPIDIFYPNHEKIIVELFRPEGNAELGLRIVGGNDTPLSNIIVQSVLAGSLVHSDGRVQSGDIIIDINGEDFHSISHVEARAVLCRNSRLIRFTLLREKVLEPDEDFMLVEDETFCERIVVSIIKPPSEQLGIKLASYENGVPGVYVEDILPGKVAHASGLLRIGDRILKIANVDLTNGNSEITARVIQGASEKFNMVVSRRGVKKLTTIANPWACEGTLPRNSAKPKISCNVNKLDLPSIPFPEIIPIITSHKKKAIYVAKERYESLGIVVAGGMDCMGGNLPIFVQDIQPLGVLGRDNRIKRGDLLLEINGVQLNGLVHGQAVNALKSVTNNCENITLIAVELNYSGKDEDFALLEELSGVHHQRSDRGIDQNNWNPSWKLWLAVPPKYRFPHNVIIRRNSWGEFGFCIVGGKTKNDGHALPILIKYVSSRSPAALQGRLLCGDEILAIDGCSVTGLSHSEVVEKLKQSTSSVKLSIMSWPGSAH